MVYDAGGGGGYSYALDPSWPGLDSGKELEIDKDEVKKILKILRDDYEAYSNGNGTLNELQSNGNITIAELGNYPAATTLSASTQAAYTQFTTQYNSFLGSYKGIISALERAVGNYEDMEQDNSSTASSVNPTTTSTQAW